MENTHTLQLGGKSETLLFDLGALEIISDITGEDAFKFVIRTDAKGLIEDASRVIYAGLKCYAEYKDQDFVSTVDDVKKLTLRLKISTITEVLQVFQRSYFTDASGEGGADTQQVNVAGFKKSRAR